MEEIPEPKLESGWCKFVYFVKSGFSLQNTLLVLKNLGA
jgi:hypothetical protein